MANKSMQPVSLAEETSLLQRDFLKLPVEQRAELEIGDVAQIASITDRSKRAQIKAKADAFEATRVAAQKAAHDARFTCCKGGKATGKLLWFREHGDKPEVIAHNVMRKDYFVILFGDGIREYFSLILVVLILEYSLVKKFVNILRFDCCFDFGVMMMFVRKLFVGLRCSL
jgi:hypothetical protein